MGRKKIDEADLKKLWGRAAGRCALCGDDLLPLLEATGSDMVTTVAGVYDILFGMRRCRIKLPNWCYDLISRVAHRGIGRGAPL